MAWSLRIAEASQGYDEASNMSGRHGVQGILSRDDTVQYSSAEDYFRRTIALC